MAAQSIQAIRILIRMKVTVSTQPGDTYEQRITPEGGRPFLADMPLEEHGEEHAPSPFSLLFGAWGACTNMTLQVYCRRKGWPLERVNTTFTENKVNTRIEVDKKIEIWGNLTVQQVRQLKIVAERCPVNLFIMAQRESKGLKSTIELRVD